MGFGLRPPSHNSAVPLKVIKAHIEAHDPKLRVSTQKIADTLAKCGLSSEAASPKSELGYRCACHNLSCMRHNSTGISIADFAVLLMNVVVSIALLWRPPVPAPREIKLLAVSQLHRQKRNCRTHSKKQIARSLTVFGALAGRIQSSPTKVTSFWPDTADMMPLSSSAFAKSPLLYYPGLKDAERRALALADNQIAANAGCNRQLLAEELGDLATLLPECDLSLEITGFEAAEIDSLLGDLVDPDRDPADELPRRQKPQSAKSAIYGSSGVISFCVATASLPRRSDA